MLLLGNGWKNQGKPTFTSEEKITDDYNNTVY